MLGAPAFFGLAGAQMPGAPVLQNAWVTPGFVAGIDYAGGSDGAVYALAASWGTKTGRFGLSGGIGSRHVTGSGSRSAYGVRLAIPFSSAESGGLGLAAFVGFGGGPINSSNADSAAFTSDVPVGAAIGWRRAFGASHGMSVYASPSYTFLSGGRKSGGLFRIPLAGDFGFTPSFGMTVGVDFGQTRERDLGGPSGVLFGVGLAYAFGHK
jgi:hypothetical protein